MGLWVYRGDLVVVTGQVRDSNEDAQYQPVSRPQSTWRLPKVFVLLLVADTLRPLHPQRHTSQLAYIYPTVTKLLATI